MSNLKVRANLHGVSLLYDRRDGTTVCYGFHPWTWARLYRPFQTGGYMWTLGPVTRVQIGG